MNIPTISIGESFKAAAIFLFQVNEVCVLEKQDNGEYAFLEIASKKRRGKSKIESGLFQAKTARGAIKNALENRRKVYCCDTLDEFLNACKINRKSIILNKLSIAHEHIQNN